MSNPFEHMNKKQREQYIFNLETGKPDATLLRMHKNCRNHMYQSKESCPEHCQWLGGKVSRCQKRRKPRVKKTKLTAKDIEINRALGIASRQKKSIPFNRMRKADMDKKLAEFNIPKNEREKLTTQEMKNLLILLASEEKNKKLASKKSKTKKNTACYKYTKEDKQWRKDGGKTGRKLNRTQKDMCERDGHIYTEGNNVNNPNCGKCWCCLPEEKHGGGYTFITNPETGRKVRTDGPTGRRILKTFAQLGGFIRS